MLFFIDVLAAAFLYNKEFKYISCYSLSLTECDELRGFFVFKYISCYSLSPEQMPGSGKCPHLNTSHVILYRIHHIGRMEPIYNLNTSHVILYQDFEALKNGTKTYLNTSHVILYQIDRTFYNRAKRFKYISCYSLSQDPGRVLPGQEI